ncbi:transcriptional regulator [Halalkalibacter hemicellulosilyticusJCM 9152]|uniref:Transcriptional regulator n=1 Tax=Halalkalibacter hemicellulosilyticusJCM 9152 TaxID=1236971 RepID=W4QDF3_9BACI|nr:transcriptional regulator [Halalkalibacter hemicellulosilyticusJCM 9152]
MLLIVKGIELDIKWLKTFIICAKLENFRKASEELFLTQPAVTKQIKRLEEHLNSQLFDRIGKNVILTQAGYKFLPYAKEFVATYERGMERFESWKQGYRRKLTIATAPQIASSFLPSLLRAFVDENPDMEVTIDVIKSYEIGEAISSGRADLGLSKVMPLQANIEVEAFAEERVILVGSTRHTGVMAESEALTTYRLITHNHPDYWDFLLNDIKRHYPQVRTMEVNQIEVTKKFIENGLGVSYLPYSMVEEEIAKNHLLEIKSEKVSTPTSATYILTRVATNEVSHFMEFLKGT